MGTKRPASAALECVRVAVRCRPLSETERRAGHPSVVSCLPGVQQVQLQSQGASPRREFTFDAVLPQEASQQQARPSERRLKLDALL